MQAGFQAGFSRKYFENRWCAMKKALAVIGAVAFLTLFIFFTRNTSGPLVSTQDDLADSRVGASTPVPVVGSTKIPSPQEQARVMVEGEGRNSKTDVFFHDQFLFRNFKVDESKNAMLELGIIGSDKFEKDLEIGSWHPFFKGSKRCFPSGPVSLTLRKTAYHTKGKEATLVSDWLDIKCGLPLDADSL